MNRGDKNVQGVASTLHVFYACVSNRSRRSLPTIDSA